MFGPEGNGVFQYRQVCLTYCPQGYEGLFFFFFSSWDPMCLECVAEEKMKNLSLQTNKQKTTQNYSPNFKEKKSHPSQQPTFLPSE